MAYTTPTTASGQVLTSAIWNASVRDNIIYLQDRADNPPRARVTHNATQSLTNGADTALAFNTEATDSAALHDTATNNSRLTVPSGQAGFWLFVAYCEFAANATGQRKLAIRVDGATVFAGVAVDAAASGVTRLAVTALLALTAGQYAEAVASQNSGGALNVSTDPQFSAQRIA